MADRPRIERARARARGARWSSVPWQRSSSEQHSSGRRHTRRATRSTVPAHLGTAVVRASCEAERARGRPDRPACPAAGSGDEYLMTDPARFRAFGCEVVIAGCDPSAAAVTFARWEEVFSRFRPQSELSRVNASASPALGVSPLFARTLARALDIAADTGGLIDPTLGAALEAAGYDRDFALLGDESTPPGHPVPTRLGEVRLDGLVLNRPPGVQIDLNGIVKALAVDEAVGALSRDGFVSAGGDLAVRGPVDVGLPGGGAVRVVRGGLATSGVVSRRWRRGGIEQHHLIDPLTGRPADSPWLQVTVSGATCLAADVGAKVAFPARRRWPSVARRARDGRSLRHARRRRSAQRRVARRSRMHLTSSPAIWYAARASGVAAYVVLTITVSIGLSMGGKAQSRIWPASRPKTFTGLAAYRRLADRCARSHDRC